MDSRRDFIKKASLIAGGLMMSDGIKKAMAINPADGSTVWDADHVVILMQENRSFDHSFGAMRGVRGFNDPRAVRLPNGNKVWLQSNAKGETFAPFRLDMLGTNSTWVGGLPHSWVDQVRARNNGRYDNWLIAKPAGHRDYKDVPFTLGFYDRQDIPFYYSFADAFTVCDHAFCSSLTGTTPNRSYLWSGTIRQDNDYNNKACVLNSDISYNADAHWETFPELLEKVGIDWRVYQNELSLPVGFKGEEESWLANFTNNPLEWFANYRVRFHQEYRNYLKERIKTAPQEIEALRKKAEATGDIADQRVLDRAERDYQTALKDLETYSEENFKKLTDFQKSIHEKAFTNNRNFKDYHDVVEVEVSPGEKMMVPKGDVLRQFREDVQAGKLPPVSWLVAPQNFSDHPSAPWYGAWYVSEALEILTQNPEVWKKTVFILCYDENDGYYDHIPPFVAPHPNKPETGKASEGIRLMQEQVNIKHEKERGHREIEDGPIGLGYRVPLVVASPWSRGGKVNSEIFDHASVLMFLENFIEKRYKKDVRVDNISDWRRTICGDLSSVFTPYQDGDFDEFVDEDAFMRDIRMARHKDKPKNFKALNEEEVNQINADPGSSEWMPRQEPGTKPALAIPYELFADAMLNADGGLGVKMGVGTVFQVRGAPFFINSFNKKGEFQSRHYSVKRGDQIRDTFEKHQGLFDLKLHGPNGFYRSFVGSQIPVEVKVSYPTNRRKVPLGDVEISIKNISGQHLELRLKDESYHNGENIIKIKKGRSKTLTMDLKASSNWYDFKLTCAAYPDFEWHYAGHVETGKESITDPKMGGVI